MNCQTKVSQKVESALQEQLNLQISALEGLKERKKYLGPIIDEYLAKINELPGKLLQMANLELNNSVAVSIYELLQTRRYEMQIGEAMQVAKVWVLQRAIEPQKVYRPSKVINISLGLALGLFLGLSLAFLVEYLDDTIKHPEDVKQILDLPVIVSIPMLPGKSPRLTIEDPTRTLLQEPFKRLVYSIKLAGVDNPLKHLLVTSSGPEEGKSLISANLAIAIARKEKRVLIVDTDYPAPMLADLFGKNNKPGILPNLLPEEIKLEEGSLQN